MPRIIFKCPHIKPGTEKAAAHLSNYVRYVATRDGTDLIKPDKASQPATKKQQAIVERLLRDFPMCRGMFEYEDYQSSPTCAAASEFITRAIEDNVITGAITQAQRSGLRGERRSSGMEEPSPLGGGEGYGACGDASKRENYVSYIAQRPRAERIGVHGLFNGTGDVLELSKIAEEVANHPGNVWLPIISLRREDAARLGYDSAKQWQALLSSYAPQIADAMKIPWNQFRWYASYHDEGSHPHVHMVCYSADGKSGFLSKTGIAKIKSGLAKNIFRQELTEIYRQQTQRRDELVQKSGEVMKELIQQISSGTLENPRIEQLTGQLAKRLKGTSGKKQYGYLKAPLKAVVDEIVDELAKDSRVAAAYDLWYQLREEVLRTYRNDLPDRLPLSQQKEFKRIKNLVIEEAVLLGEFIEIFPSIDALEMADTDAEIVPETKAAGVDDRPLHDPKPDHHKDVTANHRGRRIVLRNPYAKYQAANRILAAPSVTSAQIGDAVIWLTQAAEAGLDYAQYALGRLYLLGKAVPQDRETAVRWFTLAAEQGNQHAQFFLDHIDDPSSLFASATRLLHHMGRIFQDQAPLPMDGLSFVDSKLKRKIREKKIAMGHKPDDHEAQNQQLR